MTAPSHPAVSITIGLEFAHPPATTAPPICNSPQSGTSAGTTPCVTSGAEDQGCQGRQQAELDFQKERFAAEQAKLEADLAHQQEVARLEARKESTGELVRSVVLFLVVLAVVLTPLLAMGWLKVPPQSFSQYVAPITGITGTVLGYWFGRQDPRK